MGSSPTVESNSAIQDDVVINFFRGLEGHIEFFNIYFEHHRLEREQTNPNLMLEDKPQFAMPTLQEGMRWNYVFYLRKKYSRYKYGKFGSSFRGLIDHLITPGDYVERDLDSVDFFWTVKTEYKILGYYTSFNLIYCRA